MLVPGHAFVGWRVWEGADSHEFLETTMIGNTDFDTAHGCGLTLYDEILLKGYLRRGLFASSGFARLIDIAACRSKDIYPLE
jgi:hypothetical protein